MKFNNLDFALIFYLGIVLITSFFAKNFHPFLDFFGLVYLFLNYLIIRLFLISIGQDFEKIIKTGILWMGIIAAIFGIIGIATTYFFSANSLGYIYQDYPYFGDTIRVSGFTSTPHMLASILNISILVLLISMFEKRSLRSIFVLIILSLAYIFTFAKIVVLLIIGVIFIFLKKQKINPIVKNGLRVLSLSLFVFYMFATHFILINKSHPNLVEIRNKAFNTGEIIGETQNNYIIPTTYTTLKQSAFHLGKKYWITGVGAGNHGSYFNELKAEGLFPKHIPDYDPHSTYFGSFAETGIFGFVAILYLTFVLFKMSNHLLKTKKYYNLKIATSACLLIFFMEAISVDAINFRHLWLVFAILSAIYNLEQNEKLGKT
ncbi:MAG: O-antigen ligase family protein [Saprospiraceae bacterium]|nr:O-antigen ligase family protein [Saprospiraceae bacterium]